jgi:hypothetical protein
MKDFFGAALFALVVIPSLCFAHGGRTDSNGGHTNRSTGQYHFHSGPKSSSKIPSQTSSYKRKEKKGSNPILLIGGGLIVGYGLHKLTSKSS